MVCCGHHTVQPHVCLGIALAIPPLVVMADFDWTDFDHVTSRFAADETDMNDELHLDTSSLSAAANCYDDDSLSDEMRDEIKEFLLLLVTCNTVVVSSHSHNASNVSQQ